MADNIKNDKLIKLKDLNEELHINFQDMHNDSVNLNHAFRTIATLCNIVSLLTDLVTNHE